MKEQVRSQKSKVKRHRPTPDFPRVAWRVLASAFLFLTLLAHADVLKEYQIKAAFVYNFAKFVDWPPQRFAGPSAPIVIGTFDDNPFGEELAKIVRGRKINNRDIVVKRVTTIEEARETHILFFSAAEDKNAPQVLEALRGSAVLTVGETETFASHSGMIEFLLDSDKVRFEINADAADADGLKVSAQLLKLATHVHRKK